MDEQKSNNISRDKAASFVGRGRPHTSALTEHGVYTAHLPPTIWGLSEKTLQGLEGGQLYLLCKAPWRPVIFTVWSFVPFVKICMLVSIRRWSCTHSESLFCLFVPVIQLTVRNRHFLNTALFCQETEMKSIGHIQQVRHDVRMQEGGEREASPRQDQTGNLNLTTNDFRGLPISHMHSTAVRMTFPTEHFPLGIILAIVWFWVNMVLTFPPHYN